jgi:hypothetical protein
MINSSTEQEDSFRKILNALTEARTLAEMRAALADVTRLSSDQQLKIYLAPVRHVLASVALHTMDGSRKIRMPIERPPFSALIAYCRRRLGA